MQAAKTRQMRGNIKPPTRSHKPVPVINNYWIRLSVIRGIMEIEEGNTLRNLHNSSDDTKAEFNNCSMSSSLEIFWMNNDLLKGHKLAWVPHRKQETWLPRELRNGSSVISDFCHFSFFLSFCFVLLCTLLITVPEWKGILFFSGYTAVLKLHVICHANAFANLRRNPSGMG